MDNASYINVYLTKPTVQEKAGWVQDGGTRSPDCEEGENETAGVVGLFQLCSAYIKTSA